MIPFAHSYRKEIYLVHGIVVRRYNEYNKIDDDVCDSTDIVC